MALRVSGGREAYPWLSAHLCNNNNPPHLALMGGSLPPSPPHLPSFPVTTSLLLCPPCNAFHPLAPWWTSPHLEGTLKRSIPQQEETKLPKLFHLKNVFPCFYFERASERECFPALNESFWYPQLCL